ncbi:MAG: FkbM family methyltransferase [Conexivisphaerales archaeon]
MKRKKLITVQFRSGIKLLCEPILPFLLSYIMLNNNDECTLYLNATIESLSADGSIVFSYHGNLVKLWVLRDGFHNGAEGEIFWEGEYNFLLVPNGTVIDVGGNVGDSAIYFSLAGFKKVIVMEPFPYNFEMLQVNLKVNRIENVVAINAGYGKTGKINVSKRRANNTSSLYRNAEQDDSVEVDILTLKDIVDAYVDHEQNLVLKMDCEGCEYNILNEECLTLRMFLKIQIEFHYGGEELTKKLISCGFKVKSSVEKRFRNNNAEDIRMRIGMIYAERINKL